MTICTFTVSAIAGATVIAAVTAQIVISFFILISLEMQSGLTLD
jgi:hypothetical protein